MKAPKSVDWVLRDFVLLCDFPHFSWGLDPLDVGGWTGRPERAEGAAPLFERVLLRRSSPVFPAHLAVVRFPKLDLT